MNNNKIEGSGGGEIPDDTMTGWEEAKRKVANKIREGMKTKGISKVQFARLMKVGPSTVTKWLKGNNNFEVSTIFNIERILEIQIINTQHG